MPEKPIFTIAPANLRDLGALRRLEHECFAVDAWPLIDLMAVLSMPGIIRLKATVNDAMVGFAAADTHPEEKLGWITTIGVAVHYRRNGIAEALLAECEKRMQVPRIRLSVRMSNGSAISMYRKNGYHEVGTWAKYYDGGEDAMVLEKHIRSFP
jgi:ribosomal protein S18 acetylase RimI-like enzyme